MKTSNFDIKRNGDSAITLIFHLPISEFLTRQIIALAEQLKTDLQQQLTEVIPAYQSLTLCFNPLLTDPEPIEQTILDTLKVIEPVQTEGRLITIPVCYAPEFAPDLAAVATHCQCTQERVISQHTQPEYLIHMLGFTPGFLYLGGLLDALHCPRKKVPATAVAAGSVGIGGSQTGIYPQQSPGGWQIIGRTPLALFRPDAENPFIARPLDRVRFVAISVAEFRKLESNHGQSFASLAEQR